MNPARDRLIRELVADLKPVQVTPPTWLLGVSWLAASWVLVVALTLAQGPLRPGLAGQLAGAPRFLLECLIGLAAGAASIQAATQLAIPNLVSTTRRLTPALLLLAAWGAIVLYGWIDPALSPSMLGKRTHCYAYAALYSAGPFLGGLWILRRCAPLSRAGSLAMVGAASAAVPALVMQGACMYEPIHILSHHLAPVAVAGSLGALLGPWVLRRV